MTQRRTGAFATHSRRGRDSGPAEQLQRRVQHSLAANQQRHDPCRAQCGAKRTAPTATTVSTNNATSTQPAGMAPSPATWPASPVVNRTDESVSTRIPAQHCVTRHWPPPKRQ